MYSLQTFGIQTTNFPITTDGEIETAANKQFWEKQRRHERMSSKVVRVIVPGRNDVLLGKGIPIQTHIGNIRYRQLVSDCKDTYERSTYTQKKQITEEIVDLVKQSGGRFLKDDGAGWLEAEDEVARLKVSRSFRGIRASTKKEEEDANNAREAVRSFMPDAAAPTGKRMRR